MKFSHIIHWGHGQAAPRSRLIVKYELVGVQIYLVHSDMQTTPCIVDQGKYYRSPRVTEGFEWRYRVEVAQ